MIYFNCSKCGEALEAPESMKGELLQCPKCLFPEKIPVPSEDGPIEIDLGENSTQVNERPKAQIRSFEQESSLGHKSSLKRAMIKTGNGATRVRTFHIRLSDNAMNYLDDQINEWIDQHEDIEIKFVSTTVGIVEGKKAEPHLIVSVWY